MGRQLDEDDVIREIEKIPNIDIRYIRAVKNVSTAQPGTPRRPGSPCEYRDPGAEIQKPEEGWIPIEKRPPEDKQQVLITYGHKGFEEQDKIWLAVWDESCHRFYDRHHELYVIADDVTAWMPSPKSYKKRTPMDDTANREQGINPVCRTNHDENYTRDDRGTSQLENLSPEGAERQTGQWVMKDNGDAYCSKCGLLVTKDLLYRIALVGETTPKFCSNCGADMRKNRVRR